MFEALEAKPKGPRRRREKARLDVKNQFVVSAVAPGEYRVWLQAGKQSSMPVNVTIEPKQVAVADFELGGGGTIETRVLDGDGGMVDPASVRLIALIDGKERPMGTFVSREGDVSIDGIAPGTYRLQISSPGRIAAKTEVFEVGRDRSSVLAPVTLREWGYLKFGQPVDESRRPARLAGDVIVELREGAEGKFRRIFLTTGADVAVRPGPVDVRARMGATTFEERIDVQEGRTHDVVIVFPSR